MLDVFGKSDLEFFCPTSNESSIDLLHKCSLCRLISGDPEWETLFDLVSTTYKNDASISFRQGLALYHYGIVNGPKYLLFANKKFDLSTRASHDKFLSFYYWGRSTLHLSKGKYKLLKKSSDLFNLSLRYKKNSDIDSLARCYWHCGEALFMLSNHSQEIFDLKMVMDLFIKATNLRVVLPRSFWENFGILSLKRGIATGNLQLYWKSVECYKHLTSQYTTNFRSWYNLAKVFAHIYSITNAEDTFKKCEEAFMRAVNLNKENAQIYLKWSEFLFNSYNTNKNLDHLKSALARCRQSLSIEDSPSISLFLVDMLSILGSSLPDYNLLLEAQSFLNETRKKHGESNRTTLSEGILLFSQAKYYEDLYYYKNAIKKFSQGVIKNHDDVRFFLYLARAHQHLGDLEGLKSHHITSEKLFKLANEMENSGINTYEHALSLLKIYECTKAPHILEMVMVIFEKSFFINKHFVQQPTFLLIQYANVIDMMGDYLQDKKYYIKAIEILEYVLLIGDGTPEVHYKLGSIYSHLAEITEDMDIYERAISYYKLAYYKNLEDDHLLIDWAISLMNISEGAHLSKTRKREILRSAEEKLMEAAHLGNVDVYYHLSCLYSLINECEKSIFFLEKSNALMVLPEIEDVLNDYWLENLRNTELFKFFIKNLNS